MSPVNNDLIREVSSVSFGISFATLDFKFKFLGCVFEDFRELNRLAGEGLDAVVVAHFFNAIDSVRGDATLPVLVDFRNQGDSGIKTARKGADVSVLILEDSGQEIDYREVRTVEHMLLVGGK